MRQRFGANVRIWFLLLSVTQFHVPFYAGRTLPNFMALPFGELTLAHESELTNAVTFAISLILRSNSHSIPAQVASKRIRNAIIMLTATATVVRLELAVFLLPVVLSLVVLGKLSLVQAMTAGAAGGLGSLRKSRFPQCPLTLPAL